MTRSLDQIIASLPPKRCAKIEQRASELATLKDLREAVEQTQASSGQRTKEGAGRTGSTKP